MVLLEFFKYYANRSNNQPWDFDSKSYKYQRKFCRRTRKSPSLVVIRIMIKTQIRSKVPVQILTKIKSEIFQTLKSLRERSILIKVGQQFMGILKSQGSSLNLVVFGLQTLTRKFAIKFKQFCEAF